MPYTLQRTVHIGTIIGAQLVEKKDCSDQKLDRPVVRRRQPLTNE